jgi:glycosyltransferase involved in cell wall biosynthesis
LANAALLFNPDAYDTTGRELMGRQSAGESFMRGFLRHADTDDIYLWGGGGSAAQASALLDRLGAGQKRVTWLERGDFRRLGEPGCAFIPGPALGEEAWNRRLFGSRRYSLCGVTHTTASKTAMDAIADLMIAPVEPWDALICTSRAVQAGVQAQLDAQADYLKGRLGASRRPPITLKTIPLGINASDFGQDAHARDRWRKQLGISGTAVVVLYVGRFSHHAKMNPAPMAMALERAALETGREIHWVLSGWAFNAAMETVFQDAIRKHAPSVRSHFVDGRIPDTRFSIWSVADIFFSLSDNIQETFGLTPVEAMAAGLPSVISDWDGYRDTVRDGVDGFRIMTRSPSPGMGVDLTFRHAARIDSYDAYIGSASQFVAVDVEAAAGALAKLVEQPEMRAAMGQSAARRAQEWFDWRVIVPQYQALWNELAAIRADTTLAETPPGPNPWRLDPFTLFASYPTEALTKATLVQAEPFATPELTKAMLSWPVVSYAANVLPSADEVAQITRLASNGPVAVAQIVAAFPPARQGLVERAILFLAKYGMVTLHSPIASHS